MRNMKKILPNRVTAIVGAGAVLDICPKDKNFPSTTNITKIVIESYKDILLFDSKNPTETKKIESKLVQNIYKHLCRYYFLTPIEYFSPDSYLQFHFELIFHVMECLHTYDKVWNFDDTMYDGIGKYEYFRKDLFSYFAHFIKPNFDYNQQELEACMRIYIQRIMDIVNIYNNDFKKHIRRKAYRWYKNFWKKANFCWDIFNFNYDTTIENSLTQYNDGYVSVAKDVPFKKIDILHLLKNEKGLSTINHIHGSILFGSANLTSEQSSKYLRGLYSFEDWFKYDSYDQVPKSYQSDNVAQNGQSYKPFPIITGLDKVEKISAKPFSIYRLNLEKQIATNNSLLIVGYSFGDLYVNSILERMRLLHGDRQRVVIVDYWGDIIQKYEETVNVCLKISS